MRTIHAILYTSAFWIIAVLYSMSGYHLPFGSGGLTEMVVEPTLPIPRNKREASAFDALNIPYRR